MAGERGGRGDEVTAGTGGSPSVTGGEAVSLDTVFELLANRRRRAALYRLREADGAVLEFDALVEAVTDREAAFGYGAGDDTHRRRVERDLDTWHLEVLEEVGVAEYDRRSGSVRYHGDPGLDRWLERARRDESPGD